MTLGLCYRCYDVRVNPFSIARSIIRLRDGDRAAAEDQLAIEEPLEIRIGAVPLAVTMRTPGLAGHDGDLAAGFCLTEGIIEHADEIERIERCEDDGGAGLAGSMVRDATGSASGHAGNIIIVHLTEEAARRRQEQIACARRESFITSSCGICGRQSIDRVQQRIAPLAVTFHVPQARLLQLPDLMRQAQATFATTGGLHAAALFSATGELRLLREDVGRHNAVDKVIGASLLTGQLPLRKNMLLVSGRASFELVQKAAIAGIELLAAVGAPSSLAVDLAARVNLTLIGFLREGRMNLYHGEERVASA